MGLKLLQSRNRAVIFAIFACLLTISVGAGPPVGIAIQLRVEQKPVHLSKVLQIESKVGLFQWVVTKEGRFLLPVALQIDYINAGFVSVSRQESSFCVHIIPPYCGSLGKTEN